MLKTGLVVGAAAAVAGLGAITTFGLKSAATLEQTQIGMQALLGSAEEAQKFIGELQQFAAKTPFEFANLADAAKRILAFGGAVGIARDEVLPTLSTIGDLASVLGVGQAEIDSVIRAMGQMSSAGRLLGGDLLQITSALPGFDALGAIAAHLGVTTAEASKLKEQGLIPAQVAIEGLLEGMRNFKGAAGAMELQSQTLLGVFSTFKDTIGIALTNAFQPVIPAIKDTLAQLTPVIGAALDVLGPALGGFLTILLPLLGEIVTAASEVLAPVLEIVGDLLREATAGTLAPLGRALGAIVRALAPLAPVIGEVIGSLVFHLVPVIEELAPLIAELVPPTGELLIALMPLIPPLTDLLVIVVQLLVPLAKLAAVWADVSRVGILIPLVTDFGQRVQWLTDRISGLVQPLQSIDWGELFGAIPRHISAALDTAIEAIKALPRLALTALMGARGFLFSSGRDLIFGLWDGISSLGGWLWDQIRGFVSNNVLAPVKNFLGISSPSKVFAELGADSVAGYVRGIEDSARAASLATTAALSPAASMAAAPAAPAPVPVRADDALMQALLEKIRATVGATYGNDVQFAFTLT